MPDLMGFLNISHERQKSLALIVALLVILRSHIPTNLPKSLQHYGRGKPLSEEELAQVRQELYRQNEDGSITLLVPFRGRVSKVSSLWRIVSAILISIFMWSIPPIGAYRAHESGNPSKGGEDVPPCSLARVF